MDSPITRAEHNEFVKRMEEEHLRISHRLTETEEQLKQNNKLLISVEKLALSVESMQKQLTEQENKLDELTARDGEMWRKVVSYVVTLFVGAIMTFVFTQIGL